MSFANDKHIPKCILEEDTRGGICFKVLWIEAMSFVVVLNQAL